MSDDEKLMVAVLEIATENRDHVYDNGYFKPTFYTIDANGNIPGENGCLLGRALCKVWPEFAQILTDVDNNSAKIPSFWILCGKIDVQFQHKLIFTNIQIYQDARKPWSDCIFMCEREIRDIFSENARIIELLDKLATK